MPAPTQTREPVRTMNAPRSRHIQLNQLALKRSMSISDLLGQFAREAIERGELPDVTPGFEISVTSTGQLTLNAGDERTLTISPEAARTAADLIRRILKNSTRSLKTLDMDSPDMAVIGVRRQGPAVTVLFENDNHECVFSPSVAADIARQLDAAADKAQGKAAA